MPIRVIAVEDDLAARLLITATFSTLNRLELCGVAADGLEGLELVERFRPDAVLLDLIMPGLDGFGFLRALGREADRMAIIVTSQAAEPALVRRALELGASYYLVKPVNLLQLPDLLTGLCAKPLIRAAAALLEEIGASGKGVPAAAAAAAVLVQDPSALLKEAYALTIAAERTNYAGVEKNIRAMIEKLHKSSSAGYSSLMGGMPASRPSNLVFLRRLAQELERRQEAEKDLPT